MSATNEAQSADECGVCKVVSGEQGETVYETEHFTVSISDRYPFGLVVCGRRHEASLPTLTEDEAADFGKLATRLAAQMRNGWTDWVYMTAFGEEVPHFHVMFHARFEPISVVFHDGLSVQVAEMADQAETSRVHARAVGARLART